MDSKSLKDEIRQVVNEADDPLAVIEDFRALLHDIGPCPNTPVDFVRLVPIEKVEPNDYNPNSVAQIEMGLLLKSIEKDGYTQPVVTIYDEDRDKYVIVDGFHRYFVMVKNARLNKSHSGLLPITVIEKTVNERMAATVRHNRARGKHSVEGMANMVFNMLDNGMKDNEICNELGMEPEELLRLKHITGFSKLFKDHEYRRAWESKSQIRERMKYRGKASK